MDRPHHAADPASPQEAADTFETGSTDAAEPRAAADQRGADEPAPDDHLEAIRWLIRNDLI